MYLGESRPRRTGLPEQVKTDHMLFSEHNKNLRKIHEDLCRLIEAEYADDPILNQIRILLEHILAQGSSCETPVYASLCEIQQILDKLDEVKVQIDGDNIDVNLNLDDLENLLEDLLDQLKTPNTNHFVLDAPVYNNVKQYEISDGGTLTIPGGSVHSISYKVISGTCSITIGSDTLTYTAGESDTEEVTTLIVQQYVFTAGSSSTIKIKTIS